MNKNCKIIAAVLFLAAFGFQASAQQNLRTAYFMEGYAFRYKFNPAFQGERNYISIGAGNIGLGVESNIGISTLLYPVDGSLTTFLHPSVNADEFLGKLNNANNGNLDVDVNILGIGFHTGQKIYHNIDLSLRGVGGFSLPYDLFRFAKVGAEDGTMMYSFDNLQAKVNTYLQASYGFSQTIGRSVEFGARFKLLFGIASAQARISNAAIQANSDRWSVKAEGGMDFRLPGGIDFQTKGEVDPSVDPYVANNIDFGSLTMPDDFRQVLKNGLSGFGGAVDFGIAVHFARYFTFSASVLDLGGLLWNYHSEWELPGNEWSFDGFDEIATSQSSESQTLGDQFDLMLDDLTDCFAFKKSDKSLKPFEMIPFTVNAGLQFRMPFWQRLSVGVLGEYKFDGPLSFYEGRAVLGIEPLNFLSIHGSYAYSNYGQSFGAAFNIHAPVVNLFVGVDNLLPLREVTPQFIPVGKLNTSVNVGLTLAFGKKHSLFGKKAILPLYRFE